MHVVDVHLNHRVLGLESQSVEDPLCQSLALVDVELKKMRRVDGG